MYYNPNYEQDDVILEGMCDHRAAYFMIQAMTSDLLHFDEEQARTDLLDALAPEYDGDKPGWYGVTTVASPDLDPDFLKRALKRAADSNDGSWFADQSAWMLTDAEIRRKSSNVILFPRRPGGLAVRQAHV